MTWDEEAIGYFLSKQWSFPCYSSLCFAKLQSFTHSVCHMFAQLDSLPWHRSGEPGTIVWLHLLLVLPNRAKIQDFGKCGLKTSGAGCQLGTRLLQRSREATLNVFVLYLCCLSSFSLRPPSPFLYSPVGYCFISYIFYHLMQKDCMNVSELSHTHLIQQFA